MSSPHGHPREQQYQQLHGHQPFAHQYQYQPHVSPSPPAHTPIPNQASAFAVPGLSSSPTLAFYHSRTPSHSHPPIPTYSSSPHQLPPSNVDSNNTPVYTDQEQYYDHAAPMLRQQSQQAHPSFLPIFTLIEDSTSQEHFHPKVHYIFEDDVDTPLDIALGSRAAAPPPEEEQPQIIEESSHKGSRRRKGKQQPKESSGQDEIDGMGWPKHIRPIIVQMSQDLTHVENAYSLAPEWQLTNVQVGKAPQWLVGEEFSGGGVGSVSSVAGGGTGGGGTGIGGGNGNGGFGSLAQPEQPQEGLMLTIEGTSIPDWNKKGGPGATIGTGVGESLYDLANNFADRMAMIKRVIEFGQQQEYEEQERQRERERLQREEQEQWQQAQVYQDGIRGLGLGYDFEAPQRQDHDDQAQMSQEHSGNRDQYSEQATVKSQGPGGSYNEQDAERAGVHPTYSHGGKAAEEDMKWMNG